MKWKEENTHSFLFSQKLNFSFPPKFEGIEGNKIKFDEILTETSKISRYNQSFILKYESNHSCQNVNYIMN